MKTLALTLALPVALAASLAAAAQASADEILIRRYNPDTCELVTDKAVEVTDENWVEISYRVVEKGAIKKTPTRLVFQIQRGGEDAQASQLAGALEDLAAGRYGDAATAFRNVGGGGPTVDENGKAKFVPFGAGETGKPKWHSEYAHYYYAYAAWKDGSSRAEKDKQTLEHALRALEADKPAVPEVKGKSEAQPAERGFLVRFKEGKSRYYAAALLLRADLLADLGRHDEAEVAYDALYQKSLQLPIGVRWSYEAKAGPGRVSELKGVAGDAEARYESAAAAVESLFATATDRCTRFDLGRFYNMARMRKAQVMLDAAEKEKSGSAYARLREYLMGGTPEGLRKKFAGKPPEVVEAIVAGAMDATVQAVAQNGLGLALLAEKKHTEALFAFAAVRVKYFQVARELHRALYYLAQAADAAAAAASKPEAKAQFQKLAESTRQELVKAKGPDWTPAKK